MAFAILRMEKHKGGTTGALEKHHEREKEAYQSNPDIDLTRSVDNFHIKLPEGKYYYEVQRRIEAANCRVRKDSVRMIDTFIGATPEFIRALPAEKQREFFQCAYDFMSEKVGEENIFAAVVHMDEATLHMHLCFVPLTRDKRLSAKEILGNQTQLVRWQNDFYAHMSARFPRLERGLSAMETGRKHLPVGLFKAEEKTIDQAIEIRRLQEKLRRQKRLLDKIPPALMQELASQTNKNNFRRTK